MTITEYLNAKYGATAAKGMLLCEAKVFGIPYPLESGWARRYGPVSIDAAMAGKLRAALAVSKSELADAGLRALDGGTASPPEPQLTKADMTALTNEIRALRSELRAMRSGDPVSPPW